MIAVALLEAQNRDVLGLVAYMGFVLLVVGGCYGWSLLADIDELETLSEDEHEQ